MQVGQKTKKLKPFGQKPKSKNWHKKKWPTSKKSTEQKVTKRRDGVVGKLTFWKLTISLSNLELSDSSYLRFFQSNFRLIGFGRDSFSYFGVLPFPQRHIFVQK